MTDELDADAIREALIAHHDEEYYGGDNMSEWHWVDRNADTEVEGLPGVVNVVATTGGEGEGDRATIVFEIVAPDSSIRYFKQYGYYASYYGFEWDGPFVEVEPRERTVTVYEEV